MLFNMKLTVISIVVGTFGNVLKGLERRLEELEIRRRIEIIVLSKLAGIWERF